MTSQICVPILVKDMPTMLQQLSAIPYDKVNLLEFRLDYCPNIDDFNHIDEIFKLITQYAKLPYIITLRTEQEGGYYKGNFEQYKRLYQYILERYHCYAIDIEWHYATQLYHLIDKANMQQVQCIISYHNFECMPNNYDLLVVYHHMQKTQGTIYKFAVTPLIEHDLIRLLAFTRELDAQHQYIVIGMGQLGMMTRIMPSVFKSMLTFGSVTYNSAPGQIAVDTLAVILDVLKEGNKFK